VQTHGAKNWTVIASLIPGRTTSQCSYKWRSALNPNNDRANARMRKWTEYEGKKLKDAVQTHGGKNWDAIAALVPGRTQTQCSQKWREDSVASVNGANARMGKWTEYEGKKLKDAVQTHCGNDWKEMSALVPGRTKIQCWSRWKNMDPNCSTVREKGH
jgi:myb proto-oncogene protein